MLAYLLIPVLWLFAALTLLYLFHRDTLWRLWLEPMLSRPVLIVESDDWGPGPHTDALALRRIAALLAEHRDSEGHPAVMTLGVVLGRPDGAAILADDCRRYHRSGLGEPRYASIVAAMREGCAAGVFSLQRHGLEHCWPASLLACAQHDAALRAWLADPEARSEGLPSALQSRWVDAASLPSRALPEAAVQEAVEQEAEALTVLFGERLAVGVPNTFVWDDAVERAWGANGVRYVVTCGCQYPGRGADGALLPASHRILNGESGLGGVRYVVRDAYFEPIRGHRAEQVWLAVAQRITLGRPTLLETHRENFINPSDADAALVELGRALEGVVKRHPEVCFISTEQLAAAFDDALHPLHLRGFGARCATFLRRVRAEATLSRPLKFCGLYFLLPLAARLVEIVPSSAAGSRTKC